MVQATYGISPHWSVDNIQFRPRRSKSAVLSYAYREPVVASYRYEEPHYETITTYEEEIPKNYKSRSNRKSRLLLADSSSDVNALKFIRNYLVERQKQRQLSARLMSTFGSNVANNF